MHFYLSLSVARFPSLKWYVSTEVANVSLTFFVLFPHLRKINGNVKLADNTNILQCSFALGL